MHTAVPVHNKVLFASSIQAWRADPRVACLLVGMWVRHVGQAFGSGVAVCRQVRCSRALLA